MHWPRTPGCCPLLFHHFPPLIHRRSEACSARDPWMFARCAPSGHQRHTVLHQQAHFRELVLLLLRARYLPRRYCSRGMHRGAPRVRMRRPVLRTRQGGCPPGWRSPGPMPSGVANLQAGDAPSCAGPPRVAIPQRVASPRCCTVPRGTGHLSDVSPSWILTCRSLMRCCRKRRALASWLRLVLSPQPIMVAISA